MKTFIGRNFRVWPWTKNGIGDANDIWKIMIVGGRENDTVLTVTSKLLIVQYLQNCALTTSGKQLPKWGFEQQEVSCNPNIRDQNAYWNVEDNVFDKCKYTDAACQSARPWFYAWVLLMRLDSLVHQHDHLFCLFIYWRCQSNRQTLLSFQNLKYSRLLTTYCQIF